MFKTNHGFQLAASMLSRLVRLLVAATIFCGATTTLLAEESLDDLLRQSQQAAASGDHAKSVQLLSTALKLSPNNSSVFYLRGRAHFRAADVRESVRDFDKQIELSPNVASRQWERGIALYYTGDYELGAKQFELYQTYHDQDVENSTWRFLCMSRQPGVGVEKARAVMLPISNDPRVPMMEVYDLYRGKLKPDDVLSAAKKDSPPAEVLAGRLFYAHLYLGLYYEALGDEANAKKYLLLAAADDLKKNPRINGYMWDVARVHVALRKWREMGTSATSPSGGLRISVFQVDATPPLGTPVAYAPARKIEDPLSARGVVLLGAGKPIVLCAVDWLGIGNGGHDAWRESLARGVGTTPDRVAVHVLHQHDAVRCDFTAEELLAPHGLSGKRFDVAFVRKTIAAAGEAAQASLARSQPVTHLGVGEAKVDKVASNRRILGPDGRVAISRSSSYRIPEPILGRLIAEAKKQGYDLSATRVDEALAAPEGVIDPLLKMLTFYDNDRPLVSMSYYATHPQSHFGKGDVTAEFVGLARTQHEQARGGGTLVHFNGASGNVAAGKYNDGTPEMRVVLTDRMADGMRRAWEATKKTPLTAAQCQWRVQPVRVPVASYLNADRLRATLENKAAAESDRLTAAGKLGFVLRATHGAPIELSCLKLGDVYIVHMPGELFVEYQLAAQQMQPRGTVCMAAYGDYGPGYIGTEIAYSQGGYETQPTSSNVSPQIERVLMDGMRALLSEK